MKHPDYNSSSSLKSFLEENGMAMQKKFGQNFLLNQNARKRLIDELDIQKGTSVWEVGPGLGAMTEEILLRGAKLTAFEIDRGFAEQINSFFEEYTQNGIFTLIQGDFLKTWKPYFAENGVAERFFGNLPYNVAATMIADMISEGIRFEKSVVTVQKEVGIRMCAEVGSKDYSSFSVLCSWAYDIKPLMDLSGGNFWPKPNVDSRAMLMTKKKDWPACQDPNMFQKMVRTLFANRRKTVKNNLSALICNMDLVCQVLDASKINPQSRAEELSLEQLLFLSDNCSKAKVNS